MQEGEMIGHRTNGKDYVCLLILLSVSNIVYGIGRKIGVLDDAHMTAVDTYSW
jgi:hypothetical protein